MGEIVKNENNEKMLHLFDEAFFQIYAYRTGITSFRPFHRRRVALQELDFLQEFQKQLPQ